MARIKIEDIKSEAESLNWQLLSDTYKNLDTEMSFVCPEGHNVLTTYGKWRTSHICPICDAPKMELSNKIVPKKKGVKRILALDQATKISGWAIYDDDVLKKYGVKECTANDTDRRIHDLQEWLANMIEIWRPDLVIMEDIQLQDKKGRTWEEDSGDKVMNVVTFKTLAQLQGVLINYLFVRHIEYMLVAPSVWRETCGINGKYRNDKKKSAQLKVKDWFEIDVSNDEADAICIGKHATSKEKKNNAMLEWG